MRKLVYYIGMTIDGFIAAPDGGVDFFPVGKDVLDFIVEEYPETLPTHVRGQLGVDAENRSFDTGIQGRVTYEPALEIGVTSPYAHLRQYVVSESITESPDPAVEIVSGDPLAKVRELKAEDGKDIYLAGGGRLAGTLLPEIDRLVVKLYPVVAGAGIPLFTTGFSPVDFTLAGTRVLDGGMVVLTYDRT
ncbi:dihydrofolate reductase family protein [Planomonospora venezuelensis]|uniref:Dihydrofolate reductase n=1 Tax=Planomonospora venezuelensis TaxID=1999 RepID=A0A841D2B0_PLAVE|nr:dihydrofolate reductase family protein [Planomonospora venezuelensis]MBB5961646.1 dihydrofolate reductase [Planomonospora venezuelensis]GIM98792.1 deaminase [Planomonospora venezuelensis]